MPSGRYINRAGQLNFTAAADRDGCPDVEMFAEGVRSGLDDLRARAWGAAAADGPAGGGGRAGRLVDGSDQDTKNLV